MSKQKPKTREAALINICKPLADLQADNEIFYKGQFIIATVGDQSGIKRGDWDWINDAPESATPFNDLPWVVPISSGAMSAMPIKLRPITDDGYDVVGGEVVFTHAGLVDIADPVITCTQIGGELRDDDFTHVSETGTLTIHILDALNPKDHVTVIAATKLPVSDSVADQEARIQKLEFLLTPYSMAGSGAIWIWKRPRNQIPTGFRPVTGLEGKTIMGFDPTDPDFNAVWTKTGGAKKRKLKATDIPELSTQLDIPYKVSDHDRGGNDSSFSIDSVDPVTIKMGTPDPDMTQVDVLDPYRVVDFIELDPDYVFTPTF